jgi:hypothetical protein
MKLNSALFLSLAFLTACGLKQDPLSSAPDSVRSGVPPNIKKEASTQPLPKEALQIDVPNLINGRVGSPLEFRVSGRVMVPNLNYKLSVDNLAEFPGAIFDATTGEFKWTPSRTVMGNSPSVEIPLRLSLVTEPNPESPIISIERKTILLVIVNHYSKPIINSISGSEPILTGAKYTYPVVLEDIDAINAQDVTINVRDCSPSYNTGSIAHAVTVRKIESDVTSPNKYKGEVTLDLSAADNLRNNGTYCFGLIAVSKFGIVSDIYKKEVYIELKMKPTKITTQVGPNLTIGEKALFSFSIYDPAGLGSLTLRSMDDIGQMLPGSRISCKSTAYTRSQLDCDGVIDATNPAKAREQEFYLKFSVENAGSRVTQATVTNHSIRIQVRAVNP